MAAHGAGAQSFDGLTIVAFEDRDGALYIAPGDHIVIFVAERGSYAAVASSFRGNPRGCISAAVPGSYTGTSIAFGVAAEPKARRQGLDTLCPPFTVKLDGPDGVRIDAGDRYSRRHEVVARVPLQTIDFSGAHFARHEVKGVRLGPVSQDVGPLPATPSSRDRSKFFQRQIGTTGRYKAAMHGRAAAAEITGWPWDVLYDIQYLHQFDEKGTFAGFREAVLRQYGEPTSEHREFGYMVWLYDLSGTLIRPDSASSCRRTAEFWLKKDARQAITGIDWNANSDDFGPWGCSLIMEMRPNTGDGGVTGYFVRMANGYAMAINHLLQRVEEPPAVMQKMQVIHTFKPKLD